MRLIFAPPAWEDYRHWQVNDRAILRRVNRLIDDVLRDPFDGIGKPEQLKYGISGAWSRRITAEHRLVYVVRDDVMILQVRYHYSK